MKVKKILLFIVVGGLLVGCTDKVKSALSNGDYKTALEYIQKNPDKYKDVYDETRYHLALEYLQEENYVEALNLLQDNKFNDSEEQYKKALDLKFSIEIENEYAKILKEMEDHNPKTYVKDFDWLEGSDYYLKLRDEINEVYDLLVKDNDLEKHKGKLEEYFLDVPNEIDDAKKLINDFKNVIGFDSEFIYEETIAYTSLHNFLCNFSKKCDFARFEMTPSSGFVIYDSIYEFLKDRNVTPKTFAYLMSGCKDFEGKIERNESKIEISFKKGKNSFAYYYCLPNKYHEKLNEYYNNSFQVPGVCEYVNDGVLYNVTIQNNKKLNIKEAVYWFTLLNLDYSYIGSVRGTLTDVGKNDLKFKLFFEDLDEYDFKDGTHYIYSQGTVTFKD